MTALVRTSNGNLSVKRYDNYKSQKGFASDPRSNGFRVLKIWAGYKSDAEINE